jgi:hypothetical protein
LIALALPFHDPSKNPDFGAITILVQNPKAKHFFGDRKKSEKIEFNEAITEA